MIKSKIRGRGAQINPRNRFEKLHLEELPDNEFYPEEDRDRNRERKIPTLFFKDESRTVIAKNDSYDVGFDYSFNPYRGCEHGCIYCYARPSHEYLGFSSGIDFETKIMVKENAPALLEKELSSRSYKPDLIVFSGNTDCYQPVERKLKLTREALKVCLRHRNPVGIVTKNSLIERDIDIIGELAALNLVSVTLSVTTLDKELARKMEPRTSSPAMRLNTIQTMSENKIPVGVNIAPVIPGLNDKEIPAILKEASKRGALFAHYIMLRLPYAVKDLFVSWLKREFPDKADKIISSIRTVREGKLNSSEWGERFTGTGEVAEAIYNLFRLSRKKYNLTGRSLDLRTDLFTGIITDQLDLFS